MADHTCHGFFVFIYLSYAVVFDDIVHVLIAAAGEIDEDGAMVHTFLWDFGLFSDGAPREKSTA
ncbi:MAG: hypothetical protein IKV79_06635 [Oscillospiraceae bacterium]|nr:hypothetical protein [Oscillospiraceae bacterium]